MEHSSSDEDFEDLPPVSSINVYIRNAPNTGDASPNDQIDDLEYRDDGDGVACGTDTVAEHYNARPDLGLPARSRSAILHIRLFNNWVKSVLIREFVRGRNIKVLDLGCGKGGDLGKWNRLAVTHLTGVDIATISIEHAQQRYLELRPRFQGKFIVYDAFHKPFVPGILPMRLYDTISCQFAFHYAFESLESAKTAISNVSNSLASGGYFFGTIPNTDEILGRLRHESSDHRTLMGKHYSIVFDEPFEFDAKNRNPFGIRYKFTLEDAIDTCPEYLIPMPVFRSMCEQAQLGFVQELSFQAFYEHYSQMGEYENLLRRMDVIQQQDGMLILDEYSRDVVSLYTTFVFRKC